MGTFIFMAQPWGSVAAPVTLGQPGGVITLIEGNNFCISGRCGDIRDGSPQGFFFQDCRFLSGFELLINGQHLDPLTAYVVDPFVGAFAARVLPPPGSPDSNIFVNRRRYLGDGLRENLSITNYDEAPAHLYVELRIAADFVNLFDVKQNIASAHGEFSHQLDKDRFQLCNRRDKHEYTTLIRFSQQPILRDGNCLFELTLAPQEEWQLCIGISAGVDGNDIEPRYRCGEDVTQARPKELLGFWRQSVPVVTSNFEPLVRSIERGQEDLGSLRIFDPQHPDRAIIAAGAPWFMAPFGRDSILTAWSALLVDPSLALGTLQTLAETQGQRVNRETEEEPGKIMHELRLGGTSTGKQQPEIYYGSADSSPLFVMLLGELQRWGLAPKQVEHLLPTADRAIEWIENYGDRDGDGYVEYERLNENGLIHQGWKDSTDAIRSADGTFSPLPIAMSEIQGYVYAAYVARMHFAHEQGDTETANSFREKADNLKQRFNEDFWVDELNFFAMALDGNKEQVKVISSNIGHCLWTGIIDEDKAAFVAEKFASDEMFSGWGLRTISSQTAWYNPISYHGGAVWPHDTAIAAAGLMRYGFVREAQLLARSIFEAATADNGRPPEVFSGIDRGDLPGPIIFPTSCSPQAWSAASPMLALRTLLRFEPWITHNKVYLAPALPPSITRLRVENVPLHGRRISIDIENHQLKVGGLDNSIELIEEPRPSNTPLSSRFD